MVAKLTPEQMVMPKALAPFEVAECFAEWANRCRVDLDSFITAHGRYPAEAEEPSTMAWANGLGPCLPVAGETNREYGDRCALALFTLIKEI